MTADMDRRSFLHVVPAGLAIAGGIGVAGVSLLGATAAHAAPRQVGTISVPKLKMRKTIYAGITNDALNRGVGHGLWSPPPGAAGHTQLFGHRTSHGGVFRNLHKLRLGDAIVVNGTTYRVSVVEVLSASDPKKIWKYAGSGPRLSLVACSKGNGLPTSLKYRICVRANA